MNRINAICSCTIRQEYRTLSKKWCMALGQTEGYRCKRYILFSTRQIWMPKIRDAIRRPSR